MKSPLFRAQSRRSFTAVPAPSLESGDRLLAWLVFGLGALVFLAAATLEFPWTLDAVGRVRGVGTAPIASPGGVVRAVLVSEGQKVDAGDPLILVGSPLSLQDGSDARELRSSASLSRLRSLSRRIQAAPGRRAAERTLLERRLRAARSRLAALHHQDAIQDERVSASLERLNAIGSLVERGFVSQSEAAQRRREWLGDQQSAAELDEQMAAAAVEVQHVELRLSRHAGEADLDAASDTAQLEEARAEHARSEVEATRMLRAPVDGVVEGLQAHVGAVAAIAEPLMSVVPRTASFDVVLRAPESAATSVYVGQSVRLRYLALEHGLHAAAHGTVVRVNSIPGTSSSAQATADVTFRVLVRPASGSVSTGRGSVTPPLGSRVSASLVVESHTLVGWLLRPLRRAWSGVRR